MGKKLIVDNVGIIWIEIKILYKINMNVFYMYIDFVDIDKIVC